MRRFDAGKDAVFFHEFVVVDIFRRREIYGRGVGHTDGGGDILHRGEVVAGNNFDGDVVILEELDNFASVVTDFVL